MASSSRNLTGGAHKLPSSAPMTDSRTSTTEKRIPKVQSLARRSDRITARKKTNAVPARDPTPKSDKTNQNAAIEPASGFMSLPAELRVHIYTYLFSYSVVHVSDSRPAARTDMPHTLTWPSEGSSPSTTFRTCSYNTSILSTSKQLRNEALPLLFQNATFQFYYYPRLLGDWLGSLARKDLEGLREVRIRGPLTVPKEMRMPVGYLIGRRYSKEELKYVRAVLRGKGIVLAADVLKLDVVDEYGKVWWRTYNELD